MAVTTASRRQVLFESTTTQSGPVYRKLAGFPFIAPLSQVTAGRPRRHAPSTC